MSDSICPRCRNSRELATLVICPPHAARSRYAGLAPDGQVVGLLREPCPECGVPKEQRTA